MIQGEIIIKKEGYGYSYEKLSNSTVWNVDKIENGFVYLWTTNAWGGCPKEVVSEERFRKEYEAFK